VKNPVSKFCLSALQQYARYNAASQAAARGEDINSSSYASILVWGRCARFERS
jgi:hypothetical protein